MPINNVAACFEKPLMNAVSTTVPKYKKIKNKYPVWFTPDVNKIIQQKETLRRKWKNTKNEYFYLEIRILQHP